MPCRTPTPAGENRQGLKGLSTTRSPPENLPTVRFPTRRGALPERIGRSDVAETLGIPEQWNLALQHSFLGFGSSGAQNAEYRYVKPGDGGGAQGDKEYEDGALRDDERRLCLCRREDPQSGDLLEKLGHQDEHIEVERQGAADDI
jgi:hypothetical protein